MSSGVNYPSVARYNLSVVLDLIRRSSTGISRVEISGITGLSAQTISNVTRRLIGEELILEGGKSIGGPGKPRSMLGLNSSGRYAVGVHLDPAVITSVLLDLKGNIIARRHCATPGLSADASSTTAVVKESVLDLIGEINNLSNRVVGMGVAAPGTIDVENGMIVSPPLMSSWQNYKVVEGLSSATGLDVSFSKDVVAATVAELWNDRTSSSRNFAFLYYGTGVGVGFVLTGSVYVGASANAGDVGHMIVDPSSSVLCPCGRRGCFGDSVRPARLVEAAVSEGLLDDHPEVDSDFELKAAFSELVRLSTSGDSTAVAIFDRAASNFALFLMNVANLLDIDHIVFGGPFWSSLSDVFIDKIREYMRDPLTNSVVHAVELSNSVVGADVAAVGAACSVLDEAYSPSSAKLLITR